MLSLNVLQNENSFDFAEFVKVDLSPELFGAGSEIHTIVTYDYEAPFDVNKKYLDNRISARVSPFYLAFQLAFHRFSLHLTFLA